MNDKLTSQDKQEIQKLMQNTDDAEAIAAVVKAKANKDKNMNEEVEDELEQYEYIKSKRVQDADGFYTDYTMYFDHDNNRFVFIFGDSDLYTPEDGDFDWECDTVEEAEEWFDNYNGFEDEEIDFEVDESLNESIDISTYAELPSGISDGGINYELFRKIENGKGKWAAWETHFGERVGEPFEITYDQAIGETSINQSGAMSRYLGKKLLPKNNYLDEDTDGSFKYDVYIYGVAPKPSNVIATFDTEEEAEAYCNENDWHFIDPETTFDWNIDYRESWYGNTNESFINKEIKDLLQSKKDKQLKEDLDTISYNDYIANSFDGYSDDIDDELRILNQYARALHTVAKNIYCVQITGDDIYDITPEYTDVKPVKPINQFGTLYNVDGIDVVQDNVDAYRTDLWFKNEQLANEFISNINVSLKEDLNQLRVASRNINQEVRDDIKYLKDNNYPHPNN